MTSCVTVVLSTFQRLHRLDCFVLYFIISLSLQDIKEKQVQPPAKEDVTVVFVAVLAKEFQFNERRQKVVILQKSAGEWVNMATMTVLEK